MNKKMYRVLPLTAVAISLALYCSGQPQRKAKNPYHPFFFQEIWGYLMKGEEKELSGREPFTDILYFGVTVNETGRVVGSCRRPDILLSGRKPRMHLVVYKQSEPMVLHFCLKKGAAARTRLINDIVSCSRQFDGIQIDFETLRPDDGLVFLDFLSELRQKLPDRIISVAVPARLKKSEHDAYDYSALSEIADKIMVMAYDQHWKTSRPGPVASLPWCNSVADYATDTIFPDKLVMGLPLYGRAWAATDLNRSYKYRQIDEKLKQNGIERQQHDYTKEGPSLEYMQTIRVKVYYEDINSIHAKLRLYKSYSIRGVAFWRIGQGPEELWDMLCATSRLK